MATKSDILLLRQELGQLKREMNLEFNLIRKEMEILRSSMTVSQRGVYALLTRGHLITLP